MDYENIILQVKRSLIDTLEHVHETDITEDTKIRDELGLDSMSSLTFIMALEDNIPNFIVDAETLQAEDLYSVKSVAKYVIAQLNIN